MSNGLHRLAAAGAVILMTFAGAGAAGAATVGNGFYEVTVEDSPGGPGIGVYTATTGTMHPLTLSFGPQNVLFGGGMPSTSWTSIHSYSSGTTYTQRPGQNLVSGAPVPLILEDFVVAGEEALPVGTDGLRTNYLLTTAGGASDDLAVSQIIRAVGDVFNDSAVEITTEVLNTGAAPVVIGIRYLLDFQIGGGDDGPAFQVREPDGAVSILEETLVDPITNEFFDILDNNDPADPVCAIGPTNTPFPLFSISGSLIGPALLAPTAPTRLQFVSWPRISGLAGKSLSVDAQDAFFYARGPEDVASCSGDQDSGVAYYWGKDESTAFIIDPNQSVEISVFLFSYLPDQPPTFDVDQEGPPGDPSCDDGIDNDGDGLIDGDDPDCQEPNNPPDCTTAGVEEEWLWPPNHKFKTVEIEGVTDPDGDAVSILITGVAQDEPLNGPGDGNTCPDAKGVGESEVRLRKERSGLLDGRIYHVFFDADDGRGGVCSGEVTVCVPHDRSKKKTQCVDQGPLFDSTGPCGNGTDKKVTGGGRKRPR